MPRKIANNRLNATTYDIVNIIRQNASPEYQDKVPKATDIKSLQKVGEVIVGNAGFSNQFLNQLMNRIALVRMNSAIFNNTFKPLKKGYLEFGETVEEIFINLAKVRHFDTEKGVERELRRTVPDVRTAFHKMNFKVQYPITIEDMELRRAFLSVNGVQDLITKLIDVVYTSAEYDEYLMFKYLIIKATVKGAIREIKVDNDLKKIASTFRGYSNKLQFVSSEYNSMGVKTATPKEKQYIFMSAEFNAQFDVEVLASAFNMDKAEFMGSLILIDDFNTFDVDRFSELKKHTDMIEDVGSDELLLMKDVKAILVDEEFFQVYDNLSRMTDTYVASGMYWNYFYNTWKTISYSPYSNAIAFTTRNIIEIKNLKYKVFQVENDNNIILTFIPQNNDLPDREIHIQSEWATLNGIAVQPYGVYIVPKDKKSLLTTAPEFYVSLDGDMYKSTETDLTKVVTFTKV